MMYDTIFARSFSKHEQKKLGYGALISCFIMALCLCTVFKPYLGCLPVLNLRLSLGRVGLKMLVSTEENQEPQQPYIETKEIKPVCNVSEPRSDVYEMNGDIRIHSKSSTIFIASTLADIVTDNSSFTTRPYARKSDKTAMGAVKNFTIKMTTRTSQDMPSCSKNYSVPAILFSTGGYSGNHFHAFTDVIIPLYLTSRKFDGQVQFIIADKKNYWTRKFQAILEKLSRYEIIDIDQEDGVLCFQSMIVGLKAHKEFDIDPSKTPYSMKDFRQFLRSSYSLKRENAIKLKDGEERKRPRLLLISRKRTRSFMNIDEIVNMARKLNYDIVLTEASSNLTQFAKVVNSCDVLMGVHGAGLTNIVFLPDNAIFIQVVPLGGMEWIAKTDFGEPAKDMNLRYLEYKISERESSLIQQYPLDHQVFKRSYIIQRKGWNAFRSVYLDNQNVKLDVSRFRPTLSKAFELLHM